MTAKEVTTEAPSEIDELRQRAEDAEARAIDLESHNRDLEETVDVLNGMVGHYQQIHADAVLSTATLTSKYQNAQRKLAAAAGAQ